MHVITFSSSSGVQTTYWLEGEIPGPSSEKDKVSNAPPSKIKRASSEQDLFLRVKGRDRAHSMQFSNNPLLKTDKSNETDSFLPRGGSTTIGDDPLTIEDPLRLDGAFTTDIPSVRDGLLSSGGNGRAFLPSGNRVKADGPYYV